MKRLEAEKLLGGYATGTLTEDEKGRLFAAALEHQDLFDALVDEEALRSLLANPKVRAELLALLAAPEPALPLWRRPAFLGTAASLFALVVTGLSLWRHPTPGLPPGTEPQAAAAAPPRETPPAAAPERKSVPAAQAAPALAPEAEPQPLLPMDVKKAEAREAPPPAPAQPAAAVVEVVAAGAVADRTEARTAPASRDELSRLPAAKALRGTAHLASGVGGVAGAALQILPVHRLEFLAPPRARLRLSWPAGSHAYLLKRAGGTVQVLPAAAAPAVKAGMASAHYEFALGEGDLLDLYVLPRPAPDPARLPAEGPLPGYRARIWPEP